MNHSEIPRARLIRALHEAMEPDPTVFAGWEGGSAAFDALDDYSDIDLTFLVDPSADVPHLFQRAEEALRQVSPLAACYEEPPGPWAGMTHRIYRLADADEFLLVDLGMLRADTPDHFMDAERHGRARALFDKEAWLRPRPVDLEGLQARSDQRRRELETWFPMSQNFVRKSMLRGQWVEAIARYWAYSLRPVVELVRMRDCPVRWDFGMRYLDRDLAPEVYERIQALSFVRDFDDLRVKHTEAEAWGLSLLSR